MFQGKISLLLPLIFFLSCNFNYALEIIKQVTKNSNAQRITYEVEYVEFVMSPSYRLIKLIHNDHINWFSKNDLGKYVLVGSTNPADNSLITSAVVREQYLTIESFYENENNSFLKKYILNK